VTTFVSSFFSSATIAWVIASQASKYPDIAEKVMGVFLDMDNFKASFYILTSILGIILLCSGRRNKRMLEWGKIVGLKVGGFYAACLGSIIGWFASTLVAEFWVISINDVFKISAFLVIFLAVVSVPFFGWKVSLASASHFDEKIFYDSKKLTIQQCFGALIAVLPVGAALLDFRLLG
jgi:hypothetical protein